MPDPADAAKFIGSWRLKSWLITNSINDHQTEPFGTDPNGLIQYTVNGWMSAAVCRNQRQRFEPAIPLRKQNEQTLAQAYKSYFHYAGPWRLEGDTVIHSVEMSLNPNMVGTEQYRRFVFDGDRLTLSGEEPIGDSIRYHSLQWQRA